MGERIPRRMLRGAARWGLLALAGVIMVVFLNAQRQSADVRYGGSPVRAAVAEGSAGELTNVALPPVERMKDMVTADRVVRLPGAVAQWDAERVDAAIGDSGLRIIVAPPGLSEAQRDALYQVDNADIRIIGTRVAGGALVSTPSTGSEWREQLARDDVTAQLLHLIPRLRGGSAAPAVTGSDDGWRDPTGAELDAVAAALGPIGRYAAAGATLTETPTDAAARAFNSDGTLVAAFPAQPRRTAAVRYGPGLEARFPGRPIVVMVGNWIEYHGPHRDEFADVAAASFYARFGDRISAYTYPQGTVLTAYLDHVTEFRYAGLFDRPLPYRPVDPLRVALPALPWLFAVCVAVFLALSARPIVSSRRGGRSVPGGSTARMAGLAALAVEVSGLTDRSSDPALTRALSLLRSAREATERRLPERHVNGLLDDAERELDAVGRAVGVAGYQPKERDL